MKKIELIKIFSRERSLFYSSLWNDSDRLCFSRWLSCKMNNSLFLKENKTNKISIWNEKRDSDRLIEEIEKKLNASLMAKFRKSLAKDWVFLYPIAKAEKTIKNIDGLKKYYDHLVSWWSVMVIIWHVPNLKGISPEIKKEARDLRVSTEKYSLMFDRIFEDYFKKYFPEYKKYLQVLSPKEIYILKNRKFTKTEIKNFENRLDGLGLFNGRIYLLSDLPKALARKDIILKNEGFKDVREIKGIVASKGASLKGRVRLLLNKKAIKNFKKNEILVTEMTDPDFIPAIKKAAAIITDEGSITCHAAIVSRELKKLCIISTKIATKILKNGDRIEIDADNGIVKIIK